MSKKIEATLTQNILLLQIRNASSSKERVGLKFLNCTASKQRLFSEEKEEEKKSTSSVQRHMISATMPYAHFFPSQIISHIANKKPTSQKRWLPLLK